MVKDIVVTAVHKKTRCSTRNDFISPAEIGYAAAYAWAADIKEPEGMEQLMSAVRVEDLLALIQPRAEAMLQKHEEGTPRYVLWFMIKECKVLGEISDEERELMVIGQKDGTAGIQR